jgi:hypothetical protein
VAVNGQNGGAGFDPVLWDQQVRRHRHRLLGVVDDGVHAVAVAVGALERRRIEVHTLWHRSEQRRQSLAAPVLPGQQWLEPAILGGHRVTVLRALEP